MKKTNPDSSSRARKPEQFLYLTTTGRKSGRPREIEIWFTEHSGRYYVIAEYDTSQWVQNVRASSDVRVRVGETSFTARARLLTEEQDLEVLRAVKQLSRDSMDGGREQLWSWHPYRRRSSNQP